MAAIPMMKGIQAGVSPALARLVAALENVVV
jgi:hypothetical protein